MKLLGIILTAALLAVAPAYGQAQKESPAPKAKSYTAGERQAYEKKTAGDLEDLEAKIHDLNAKAHAAAPQIKRTMLRAMLGLQKQSLAAKNKLAGLEKASEKDWGGLKVDMDKAMQELTKAYEDAESRLK